MFSDIKIPDDIKNTFEITAVYYAGVFWNELYNLSVQKFNNETGHSSLTEIYKNSMLYYHKSMCEKQANWLHQSLTHIKYTFRKYDINILTMDDCLVQIANSFIPLDYCSTVKLAEKRGLVYKCLSNSIGVLINKIIDDYLPMIIDNHVKDNMRVLKNIIVDIYIIERENVHSTFVNANIGKNAGSQIDVCTAKKLLDDIKKVKVINDKLNSKLDEHQKIVEQYKHDIDLRDKKIKELMQQKIELSSTLERYKKNVLILIKKNKDLQSKRNASPIERFGQFEQFGQFGQFEQFGQSEQFEQFEPPKRSNRERFTEDISIIPNFNSEPSSPPPIMRMSSPALENFETRSNGSIKSAETGKTVASGRDDIYNSEMNKLFNVDDNVDDNIGDYVGNNDNFNDDNNFNNNDGKLTNVRNTNDKSEPRKSTRRKIKLSELIDDDID